MFFIVIENQLAEEALEYFQDSVDGKKLNVATWQQLGN